MDMFCPATKFKPGDRILGGDGWGPEIDTLSIDSDKVVVTRIDGEAFIYRRGAGELIRRYNRWVP